MDVIRDDRHHRTGLVVVEEVCLALQRDTALGKGWIGTDTITFFHTEKHARELFIAAARFKNRVENGARAGRRKSNCSR